jgi:phosphoglycolate phosphatase-like HAD superfamily hydrolase
MKAILSRKHWIFDLDGTLTVAVHDFMAIKAALGIPPESDILGYLAALSPEEAAPLHNKLHSIEQELSAKTTAATGARELLSMLAEDDCLLGVVTRNTHAIARLTLELTGLAEFFPEPAYILGRYDAPPKPDPAGAVQLARLWNAAADDIVFTGDYLYDLLCGRSIGAATIHVDPSGLFRWSEHADLQVTSLLEVVKLRRTVFTGERE